MTPTPTTPLTTEQQASIVAADSILNSGITLDQLVSDLKARAETRNKAAQSNVPPPPTQVDPDWQARKAYLLDGQSIHGDTRGLADFYFPTLAALNADDQVAFSRGRDLIFKALRTMLGDPPDTSTLEAVAASATVSEPATVSAPPPGFVSPTETTTKTT